MPVGRAEIAQRGWQASRIVAALAQDGTQHKTAQRGIRWCKSEPWQSLAEYGLHIIAQRTWRHGPGQQSCVVLFVPEWEATTSSNLLAIENVA